MTVKTLTTILPTDMAALKADIDNGIKDLAKGRVEDFDIDRIIKRGKKLLKGRSPSA